jgi:hypothetical protein
VRFGEGHPNLYRLMFSQDLGRDMHLNARALAAFGALLELLERGQKEGVLRRRRLQSQAAACWAEVHGITMLVSDGLFVPEKVGQNAIEEALTTLLDACATHPRTGDEVLLAAAEYVFWEFAVAV